MLLSVYTTHTFVLTLLVDGMHGGDYNLYRWPFVVWANAAVISQLLPNVLAAPQNHFLLVVAAVLLLFLLLLFCCVLIELNPSSSRPPWIKLAPRPSPVFFLSLALCV